MVQDFFTAALPWLIMGLSAGIVLGTVAYEAKAKKEGKQVSATPTYYIVGVLWFLVAFLEMIGKDQSLSNTVTYMVIGSAFIILHFMRKRQQKEE